MTEENEFGYSAGDNYDDAIVGIAIGNDVAMEMDADDSDGSFDDFVAGITTAINIDDADIDREETWLRRCTGDLPNAIETNPGVFSALPPEVQMKVILDLRESEKATLLKSLRECSSVVERLKEQLYESEDKRMELEEQLDIENTEMQEMKREVKEMKEAHSCRLRDIERILKEMIVQRERLSTIIEQRQRSNSMIGSTALTTMVSPTVSSSERSETSREKSDNEDSVMSGIQSQNKSLTDGITKSDIEIEFERKLQNNPEFREEFERFKEFQAYYQALTRRRLQQTDESGDIDESGLSGIPFGGDEYRKMLEFQLAYERILSYVQKKRKHS